MLYECAIIEGQNNKKANGQFADGPLIAAVGHQSIRTHYNSAVESKRHKAYPVGQ